MATLQVANPLSSTVQVVTDGTNNSALALGTTRVGIGNSSPQERLHVSGPTAIDGSGSARTSFISNAVYAAIYYTSAPGGEPYPFNGNGNLVIQPRSSAGLDIVFATGTTTPDSRMVVKASGRVGIGTTAPAAPLHVAGAVRIDSGWQLGWGDDTTRLLGVSGASGYFSFITNGVARVRMAASGNIGVGTTAPYSTLSVVGTGSVPSGTHDTKGILNIDTGLTDLVFTTDNNSPFTSSIQHRHSTLDAAYYPIALNPLGGNVGIGTTTPNGLLHVDGDAVFKGPTPWADVLAFGAKNDDSDPTGTTAAFVAALQHLPDGGILFCPAGTYSLNAQLVLSTQAASRSIAIVGAGRKLTYLKWTGATGGLTGVFTNQNTLTIRSLSLTTATAGGGTALYAEWIQGNNAFTSLDASDIHIGPSDATTHYWTKGIVMKNATLARVHEFGIHGKDNTTNTMVSAIECQGNCTPVYIASGDVFSVTEAIVVLDATEGLHVTDIEVAKAITGVRCETTELTPGTSIMGCHFNVSLSGVHLVNRSGVAIIGNLIFRGAAHDFAGIWLEDCRYCQIIGNNVVNADSGSGAKNGIVLDTDTDRCTVTGNLIIDMASAIWFQTGSTNHLAVGNRTDMVTNVVQDDGTGNVGPVNVKVADKNTSTDVVIGSNM